MLKYLIKYFTSFFFFYIFQNLKTYFSPPKNLKSGLWNIKKKLKVDTSIKNIKLNIILFYK